ncbi:hypothetical protein G9F71_012495 [Clostridium sp. FP2]|uniref:hypothetical protein n=1 Tax=Clostridium sp. FP2 TaxID=2724481 RepID=UPI0013E93248|nr:hypothetical protein [Clostridium sp. FP2]MBZ9623670.1 hypothetical protein [Clostridium sp. FP2]
MKYFDYKRWIKYKDYVKDESTKINLIKNDKERNSRKIQLYNNIHYEIFIADVFITIIIFSIFIIFKLYKNREYNMLMIDITTFTITTLILIGSILKNQLFNYEYKNDYGVDVKNEDVNEMEKLDSMLKSKKTSPKLIRKELDVIFNKERKRQYKKFKTRLRKLTLLSFIVYSYTFFIITGMTILAVEDYFGYKLRIYFFILGFIITMIAIIRILKSNIWSFWVCIASMIGVYIILLIYGSFIFGSYYYTKEISVIEAGNLEVLLKQSIKIGMNSFFNYTQGVTYDQTVVKFVQFVSGKIMEWTLLGSFSALFLSVMTPKYKE